MSPTLSSHGVLLPTALAFRLQKSFPQQQVLRSCISSEGMRRDKKKKRRVLFADNVVDPRGDGEEFRRKQTTLSFTRNRSSSSSTNVIKKIKSFNNGGKDCSSNYRGMPENRMAHYNGILRDRVVHQRFAYSY